MSFPCKTHDFPTAKCDGCFAVLLDAWNARPSSAVGEASAEVKEALEKCAENPEFHEGIERSSISFWYHTAQTLAAAYRRLSKPVALSDDEIDAIECKFCEEGNGGAGMLMHNRSLQELARRLTNPEQGKEPKS